MLQAWMLAQRQRLPLEAKVMFARKRIREWHDHWGGDIEVRFSGGADSTVLLHLVRSMYSWVRGAFLDTGLEFPEIRQFVKEQERIDWIRPRMHFKKVIERYGYPIVSKEQARAIYRYHRTKDPEQRRRRLEGWPKGKRGTISKKWRFLLKAPFAISDECCRVLKVEPLERHEKATGLHPLIGTLAEDSRSRKMHYLAHGCNAFDLKRAVSRPLSVWTRADIWEYIRTRKFAYSAVYDMGYQHTGCIFCGFGAHLEEAPNRFQRLKQTHPKLWSYAMDKLGLRNVLACVGVAVE